MKHLSNRSCVLTFSEIEGWEGAPHFQIAEPSISRALTSPSRVSDVMLSIGANFSNIVFTHWHQRLRVEEEGLAYAHNKCQILGEDTLWFYIDWLWRSVLKNVSEKIIVIVSGPVTVTWWRPAVTTSGCCAGSWTGPSPPPSPATSPPSSSAARNSQWKGVHRILWKNTTSSVKKNLFMSSSGT